MKRSARFSDFQTHHMRSAVNQYVRVFSENPGKAASPSDKKEFRRRLDDAVRALNYASLVEAIKNDNFRNFLKEHEGSALSRRGEPSLFVPDDRSLSLLNHKDVLAATTEALRQTALDYKTRFKVSESKASKLEGQVDHLTAQQMHTDSELDDAHKRVEELEQAHGLSQKDLRAKEAELRAVYDRLDRLTSRSEAADKSLRDRDIEVIDLRKRMRGLQAELDEMRRVHSRAMQPPTRPDTLTTPEGPQRMVMPDYLLEKKHPKQHEVDRLFGNSAEPQVAQTKSRPKASKLRPPLTQRAGRFFKRMIGR